MSSSGSGLASNCVMGMDQNIAFVCWMHITYTHTLHVILSDTHEEVGGARTSVSGLMCLFLLNKVLIQRELELSICLLN